MIKTTQLKGNQLRDRLKKLSQPLTEVVSQIQPTKYHDRMSPSSRILQTFHKQNENPIEDIEDEDEDFNVEDFLSEIEDEIMLDEILEEMGYYEDEEEQMDEVSLNSKGYKEGRKLVDKLRRGLFRELDDEELDEFMDVLSTSFDMIRR